MVKNYQKKISGPLMDRIDIHVEVPRVDYEKLSSDRLGEPSQDVRARVEAARERGLEFPCQVSTEESMPCGYGACAGCVVPLRSDSHPDGYRYGKSCVEGPVFPVEAIRWDLMRSIH